MSPVFYISSRILKRNNNNNKKLEHPSYDATTTRKSVVYGVSKFHQSGTKLTCIWFYFHFNWRQEVSISLTVYYTRSSSTIVPKIYENDFKRSWRILVTSWGKNSNNSCQIISQIETVNSISICLIDTGPKTRSCKKPDQLSIVSEQVPLPS